MEMIYEAFSELEKAGKKIALFDLKKLLKEMKVSRTACVFDVHIAAYLLNPLKNSYGFEEIAEEYLHLSVSEKTKREDRTVYDVCSV